jgi:hypothetical protein
MTTSPAGYELADHSPISPRLDKGKGRAKEEERDEVDGLDESDEEVEELLKHPEALSTDRETTTDNEPLSGRERSGSGNGGTRGNGGGRDGKLLDRMLGGMSASQRRTFGREMLREVRSPSSLSLSLLFLTFFSLVRPSPSFFSHSSAPF